MDSVNMADKVELSALQLVMWADELIGAAFDIALEEGEVDSMVFASKKVAELFRQHRRKEGQA